MIFITPSTVKLERTDVDEQEIPEGALNASMPVSLPFCTPSPSIVPIWVA